MVRQRQSNVERKGGKADVLDASVGSYEDFADGINRPKREVPEDEDSEDEGPPPGWLTLALSISKKLLFLLKIVLFTLLVVLAYRAYFFNSLDTSVVAKTSSVPSGVLRTDSKDKSQWQKYLESRTGKVPVLQDRHIEYKEGKKLLLVIAGFVFDVTSGGQMYEKGSGYHGFIGQDGTRAFITGKFDEEGLVPDIDGLEPEDLLGLSKWIDFYLSSEKYKFVGLHRGTFFNKDGTPTQKMLKFREDVMKAEVAKLVEEEHDKRYPSCNMEWSQARGSRLWCSAKSGGIDRDWIGWPRIFKEDGKDPRCACVRREFLRDSRLEVYKGCPADSIECSLKE